MIGDTSDLIDEIAHPIYRSKDGVVYGIIDAISHQLTVVFNMFNLVAASVHAQEAVGQDLDSLARLLGVGRGDETDKQFRTRLLSHVNTYEKNTIDTVEDFVEDLIGYRPDVKEYFDQNSAEAQIMMERYGLPHTFGTFVIELPWNYGHHESLVQTKLETGSIKAAGIRAFVEVVKKFVLQLTDGFIVDEFQTMEGIMESTELIPGHGTVGNGFDNVPGFDTILFDATVRGIRDEFLALYGSYLKELSEIFAAPTDLMTVVFKELFSGPFQDQLDYPKLGRYDESTFPTPTLTFWVKIGIDDPNNDKIAVADSPLTGDITGDSGDFMLQLPEGFMVDALQILGQDILYSYETFPTPTLAFLVKISIDDPVNDKITVDDSPLTGDIGEGLIDAEELTAEDLPTMDGILESSVILPGYEGGSGFEAVPGFDTVRFDDPPTCWVRDNFLALYGTYTKYFDEPLNTPGDLFSIVFLEQWTAGIQDQLDYSKLGHNEEDAFPTPTLTFWIKIGIDDPTNDKITVVDGFAGDVDSDFPESISTDEIDSLEGGEIEQVTAWADGPVTLTETSFDSDLTEVAWRCGTDNAKFGTIRFGGAFA